MHLANHAGVCPWEKVQCVHVAGTWGQNSDTSRKGHSCISDIAVGAREAPWGISPSHETLQRAQSTCSDKRHHSGGQDCGWLQP